MFLSHKGLPAVIQRATLPLNIHSKIYAHVRGVLIHWQELLKSPLTIIDLGLPTALACLNFDCGPRAQRLRYCLPLKYYMLGFKINIAKSKWGKTKFFFDFF